jgi:hypothetical protein
MEQQMSNDTNEVIGKALLRDAEIPKPCILCNSETRNRGVFCPDNSQKYGAPAGKHRVIIYALCDLHKVDPETLNRIETVIETGQGMN